MVTEKEEIALKGKTVSYDVFDRGEEDDTLKKGAAEDELFSKDSSLSLYNHHEQTCTTGIDDINTGDSGDIIDLTSSQYSINDIMLTGDDFLEEEV